MKKQKNKQVKLGAYEDISLWAAFTMREKWESPENTEIHCQ